MTDVTIIKDKNAGRAGRKPAGVSTRKVTTASGEKVTIRAVDANSPQFGKDFLYVFTKNVEAAREENKRLFGSASGVQIRR